MRIKPGKKAYLLLGVLLALMVMLAFLSPCSIKETRLEMLRHKPFAGHLEIIVLLVSLAVIGSVGVFGLATIVEEPTKIVCLRYRSAPAADGRPGGIPLRPGRLHRDRYPSPPAALFRPAANRRGYPGRSADGGRLFAHVPLVKAATGSVNPLPGRQVSVIPLPDRCHKGLPPLKKFNDKMTPVYAIIKSQSISNRYLQ